MKQPVFAIHTNVLELIHTIENIENLIDLQILAPKENLRALGFTINTFPTDVEAKFNAATDSLQIKKLVFSALATSLTDITVSRPFHLVLDTFTIELSNNKASSTIMDDTYNALESFSTSDIALILEEYLFEEGAFKHFKERTHANFYYQPPNSTYSPKRVNDSDATLPANIVIALNGDIQSLMLSLGRFNPDPFLLDSDTPIFIPSTAPMRELENYLMKDDSDRNAAYTARKHQLTARFNASPIVKDILDSGGFTAHRYRHTVYYVTKRGQTSVILSPTFLLLIQPEGICVVYNLKEDNLETVNSRLTHFAIHRLFPPIHNIISVLDLRRTHY